MKLSLRYVLAGLCSLCLLVTLSACGTTVESQQQRFSANADSMDLLATKQPMNKKSITDKLNEFKAEQTKIMAGAGDQKQQLLTLNRRMEKYLDQLDPSRVKKKAVKPSTKLAPAGSKLAAPGATPTGKAGIIKPGSTKPVAVPVGAPGGKLGAKPGMPGAKPAMPGKLGAPPASAGKLAMPPPAKMLPPPPGMKMAPRPAGKLGAPAGKLGAPAGKLGAPAGKLGAPAGKMGAPPKKMGAPTSRPTR